MQRDEALNLMEANLPSASLRKHSLASEAVMKALARQLGKNADETARWGVLGLLHDLDYEQTQDSPNRHGLVSVEMLKDKGFEPEELLAIQRHNAEALGLERLSQLDNALTCAEVVTGLITAAALVHPEKKLSAVKASSVVKKMKDKAFARSVNRDHIKLCTEIGMETPAFVALALTAMTEISTELEL